MGHQHFQAVEVIYNQPVSISRTGRLEVWRLFQEPTVPIFPRSLRRHYRGCKEIEKQCTRIAALPSDSAVLTMASSRGPGRPDHSVVSGHRAHSRSPINQRGRTHVLRQGQCPQTTGDFENVNQQHSHEDIHANIPLFSRTPARPNSPRTAGQEQLVHPH